MPPEGRTRYYPAVGPAIPRRWTNSSRVTHPFATDPCGSVRLACVKHAASVRPEPGSNSPREFDESSLRTTGSLHPNRPESLMRSVSLTRPFSSVWYHRVRTHHDPCSIICQRAVPQSDSRQLSPGAHQSSRVPQQGQVRDIIRVGSLGPRPKPTPQSPSSGHFRETFSPSPAASTRHRRPLIPLSRSKSPGRVDLQPPQRRWEFHRISLTHFMTCNRKETLASQL